MVPPVWVRSRARGRNRWTPVEGMLEVRVAVYAVYVIAALIGLVAGVVWVVLLLILLVVLSLV